MIYYLAIGFPLLILLSPLVCLIFCRECREHAQEMRDAMQMRVGREINEMRRKERTSQQEENVVTFLVRRQPKQ